MKWLTKRTQNRKHFTINDVISMATQCYSTYLEKQLDTQGKTTIDKSAGTDLVHEHNWPVWDKTIAHSTSTLPKLPKA